MRTRSTLLAATVRRAALPLGAPVSTGQQGSGIVRDPVASTAFVDARVNLP
jgi:hypothetical protein